MPRVALAAAALAAVLAVAVALGRSLADPAPASGHDPTLEERVWQLEDRLASVEGRLAALEAGRGTTTAGPPADDPARVAAYRAGFERVLSIAAELDAVFSRLQRIAEEPQAGPPLDRGDAPSLLERAEVLSRDLQTAIGRLDPPPCYAEAHAAVLRWARAELREEADRAFAEARRLFAEARC